MAFTWDGGGGTYTPGTGSFEGWDEFPEYGFPQSYNFNWDDTPWIEKPYSIQGEELNPLPNLDTMDPEARNALLNGGYDPTMASMYHKPEYETFEVARYRDDPFGGYRQYQGKDGTIGYLNLGGRYLDEKNSLVTNLDNANSPKWKDPRTGQETWGMGYDPYGGRVNRSLYKIRENVGQGWFSKNMDWLVPMVIGGLGGGLAASGVGMGTGATGAAAGGAAGAAASTVPAWAPSLAGTTFSTAMPTAAAALEASTLAGMGLSAAEMGALGLTPAFAQAGINSTLADMFPVGGDSAFNTPMSGMGSGSVPAEGATMFDEIFGIGANEANMSLAPSAFGPEMDAILSGAQGGMSFPGVGGGILEAVGPTSGFGLSDIFNWMKSPQGQLAKEGLRLGSSIIGDQSAKNQQQRLTNYLNQQQAAADPFGPQRPFYQQELQKSYIDPLEIYNRPEYQGLKQMFEEGIRRRDAAKGRRVANEFPRAVELQDHFMKYLSDYRQGLQNPAGTTISPNNVGALGQIMSAGLGNRYNALNNYGNVLGKMFDPYENQKQGFLDRLTSIFERLG